MNVPCPQCGRDRWHAPKTVDGPVSHARACRQRCRRCGNDARRAARRTPRPDASIRVQCPDCGEYRTVKGATLGHGTYADNQHRCRACSNTAMARRRPTTRTGDRNTAGTAPAVAVHFQPGSDEKIVVLQARVAAGERLHHPDEPTGYTADVERRRRLCEDIGDAAAEKAFRAQLDATRKRT